MFTCEHELTKCFTSMLKRLCCVLYFHPFKGFQLKKIKNITALAWLTMNVRVSLSLCNNGFCHDENLFAKIRQRYETETFKVNKRKFESRINHTSCLENLTCYESFAAFNRRQTFPAGSHIIWHLILIFRSSVEFRTVFPPFRHQEIHSH